MNVGTEAELNQAVHDGRFEAIAGILDQQELEVRIVIIDRWTDRCPEMS